MTDDEPSLLARWRARRARKKARIRAMSRGKRIARRAGIIGTWLLGGVALLMVALVVAFYTLTDVPRPSDLPLPQVATILYSDGSVLARIGDQDRTIVSLDQVPEAVRYDVIAAEDRGFYSEPGVSIKGTLRAAFTDLTGGDTQGGSTITQQYVKNAYLSDSRTLSRKLQELLIAVKLDRQYTKDQILEYYLNTVYFGRGAYGIEAAAQAFFGTTVSKLNVAQGAVLAALLRAPSYYDPAGNPAAAKERWQYVIDGMVTIKQLTQPQAAALGYPTVLPPKKTNGLGATGNTALIVHRVLVELEANGITQDDIYKRGLQIKTTIDSRAQAAALTAISQTFSGLTAAQKNMKNSLVAVDPSTGGVLAYYGGSGPDVKNYAGQYDSNDYGYVGTRPPGSSFKPYTLATVLTQTLAADTRHGQADDRQPRRRQLLRDGRRHQDLQRPQRRGRERAVGDDRQRDEVLAEHDVRPAGLPGRAEQRREDRARDGHPQDRRVRQSAARGQGRHHLLRHRHRRLPGQPDRPGRRVRHLRQRRHPARRLTSWRRRRTPTAMSSTSTTSPANARSTARSPTTSR